MARAALAAMYQPSSGTRVSRRRPSAALEDERRVGRRLIEHRDAPVGRDVGAGRERGHGDAGLGGETLAPVGVDGDHAAACALGLEQLELGLEVLLERGVVVEVVVAEVREAGDVEHEPVDAVARECLGRNLDADGAHVGLAHAGEQRVQLARLGRRQRAGDGDVADAALGGRREAGDDAELAQDAVEQVHDAGLAVRAGDGEERRRVLGRAVDPRGDVAERRPSVGRHEHRQSGVSRELGAGLIGEQGDGAGLAGGAGELRAVRVAAGDTHVEVARVHRRRATG